jgi:hypothetical protein
VGARWWIVAAAAALAITSCGGDKPNGRETAFIREVGVESPGLKMTYEDHELIDMGHEVCDAVAGGASKRDVLDSFEGMSNDVAMSKMAAVAVVYICPEYLDQMSS